jgi:hypothetical protein
MLTPYSAYVSQANWSLLIEHTGSQLFDIAAMIHGFLLCKKLFGDTIGLDTVHVEGTLLLVQGVETKTSALIDISA